MRTLLVEDDEAIGQAVKDALNKTSSAVDWVQDGELALASLMAEDYSLVLLDLGLPKKSGLEVLESIRSNNKNMPVIIITARDSIEDRIIGLDKGADDYLVKPFSIDELHARIRAVVRRNNGIANPIISNSLLELNPSTCEVSRDNQIHALSAREFALLHTLMLRPGTIFRRTNLEQAVYGWNEEVSSDAIGYIIHALRTKIGKDAIKNIRGIGWMVIK